MSTKANLSAKDEKFRNFSLNDNMWKVVLYVGTPLALYQSLNQLFKIFDSMMAAHISANSVSAVAYLSQINMMLSALGGGLAIGSSLKISEAYGCAVLLKGGHRIDDAHDLLYGHGEYHWFEGARINNPNAHGTGCTLSSAIASNLAKGFDLAESVKRAKDYVSCALAAMLDLGQGSGPVQHNFDLNSRFADGI